LDRNGVVVLKTRRAHGLAGARRHLHPLELAGQRALAREIGLFLLPQALALLLEPGRIVALPRDSVAAIELEDPARHVVEEIAIVGDRDARAGVFLQEALEPRHPPGGELV